MVKNFINWRRVCARRDTGNYHRNKKIKELGFLNISRYLKKEKSVGCTLDSYLGQPRWEFYKDFSVTRIGCNFVKKGIIV